MSWTYSSGCGEYGNGHGEGCCNGAGLDTGRGKGGGTYCGDQFCTGYGNGSAEGYGYGVSGHGSGDGSGAGSYYYCGDYANGIVVDGFETPNGEGKYR
jgi:hypothetical protein